MKQSEKRMQKSMILVTSHLSSFPEAKTRIVLKADRRALAKRRFRAKAEDGADFGFDLSYPLSHGTPFHETEDRIYVIEQREENVLKIPYSDGRTGAYYGWMVGNMHFPADFESEAILAEDDPAVRQMLDRNHIPYEATKAVFQPPTATAHHSH